jgi:ATP-dependent exoDNAse (exonuclease V) alpha subunit
MAHRSELWNSVEKTEKRKDAQVAREINIALPRELTHEQNWQLAKAFVQKEFVSKGMVADLNLHAGHEGQEE